MVKVLIQTGAVDGIITFTDIPKNFKASAKDNAKKLENIKLYSRTKMIIQ